MGDSRVRFESAEASRPNIGTLEIPKDSSAIDLAAVGEPNRLDTELVAGLGALLVASGAAAVVVTATLAAAAVTGVTVAVVVDGVDVVAFTLAAGGGGGVVDAGAGLGEAALSVVA